MPENRNNFADDDHSRVDRLVDDACGGDGEAFGDLYQIYVGPVYRYVYFQTRDRMTADDITSEVFIKAWKAIRTCKGKGSTFRAWLLCIARNTLIDTTRKKYREYRRMSNVEPDALMTEPESLRLEMLDLVGRLPPEQREVIMLRFVQDLDNKEISLVIGKKEGTIRMLKMRALSNLRAQLTMTKESDVSE